MNTKLPLVLGFVILAALLSSAITAEATVRYILRFPPTGITNFINITPSGSIRNGTVYENVYRPYARYFSLESGYKVYSKNNLGLPGINVPESGKRKIFVLGNSFIEAKATQPALMASSIFMKLLQACHRGDYQVINLGLGGLTPYSGFFRLRYWSSKLVPDYVILVLEGNMVENARKLDGALYNVSDDFGNPATDLKLTIPGSICAASAFINLVRNGIKYSKNSNSPAADHPKAAKKADDTIDPEAYAKIMRSIDEFDKIYGNRFMVFSLLNPTWNNQMSKDLKQHNIKFGYNNEIRINPKNLMNKGHFNDTGNKALGYELFNSFVNNFLRP